MGVKSAGDACDERAERECQQLGPGQINSHSLGRGIVLVDGDHGAAKPHGTDAPNHEKADRIGDDELPELGQRRNSAKAGRPARGLEVQEEDTDDLAETERQYHHVDAANAQRRRADDEAGNSRWPPPAASAKANGRLPW